MRATLSEAPGNNRPYGLPLPVPIGRGGVPASLWSLAHGATVARNHTLLIEDRVLTRAYTPTTVLSRQRSRAGVRLPARSSRWFSRTGVVDIPGSHFPRPAPHQCREGMTVALTKARVIGGDPRRRPHDPTSPSQDQPRRVGGTGGTAGASASKGRSVVCARTMGCAVVPITALTDWTGASAGA